MTAPPRSSSEGPDLSMLMQRVAERDREAFAALYLELAPRLRGFLLARGSVSGQEEELVQETLLIVWKRAGSYDPSKAAVTTWVFTIARNRFIDRVRKASRPEPDPQDPAFSSVPVPLDESVGQERRAERLHAALLGLPEEQLDVLQRTYFAGQAQSAVAESLGVPLGTIKSRARLAMNRLRGLLGDDG